MKKVLSLFLSALLLVTATMPVAAESGDERNIVSIYYGDANGDGAVNARDAALLQQYVAGSTVTMDEVSADANADGAVNARDVALLQQYVAGWNVELKVVSVELPKEGYDIDGRGRVFAKNITLKGDTVSVKIVNGTRNWITEETSYVRYICTDAEGNVLTLSDPNYGVLFIGMLEVGESIVGTITLPEGTAKVEFGNWHIVYWTPWV